MDLNDPLGMTPRPSRRWWRSGLFVVGGLTAVAASVVAYVLATGDPLGGRPYVVVSLPPASPPQTTPLDTTPTGALSDGRDTLAAGQRNASPPSGLGQAPTAAGLATRGAPEPGADRAVAERGVLERGVMVYRGTGEERSSAPRGPLVIDVSRVLDDPLGKNRAVQQSGTKRGDAVAKPQPRVAIFVSGLGLDQNATRTATEIMPAAVSLAFLPYGDKVAAEVGAAAAKGHETLLQLPMRNDANSPGPHALRPDAPADSTRADLAWMLGRFGGYDGVVNLLGAPVTADSAIMTIVLKTVGARHLFYLDDGTSRRSVAVGLAPDLGVDAVKADLVLDASSDPSVVRANLDKLVEIAKLKGHAIGMASGLPEHLAEISRFAADLGGKGVALVPVSALVRPEGSQAAGATAQR